MSDGGPCPPENTSFRWQMRISPFDPFILYDVGKVIPTIFLFFFAFIEGTDSIIQGFRPEQMIADAKLLGLCSLIFLALIIPTLLLLFWRGAPLEYHLSPEGANLHISLPQNPILSTMAVAKGGYKTDWSITWPKVRHLKVHSEPLVISLMNSWRVVFRLYCTPENFPAVLEAVIAWWQGAGPGREPVIR